MNYLWEAMVQAARQGVPEESIRFCIPESYSAYMEISNAFVNQDTIDGQRIEINPNYRFQDIFGNLYRPDYQQEKQLRDSLFHLILHLIAGNDVLSGMTREEYCKALLLKDIKEGKYGGMAGKAIDLFDIDEQQIILSGMMRQYRTGGSLLLFREMMEMLIPDHIVYHSNDDPRELLIYISRKKTDILERKMEFLTFVFLDLKGKVDIYYEYHFGILGVEQTMIIDEIMLY